MRLATLTFLALASPAVAQDQCGPRGDVLSVLTGQYGETQQSQGFGANVLMEVFANPETGSWTIAVTMPSGVTCLVASGADFHAIPQGVKG